MMLILAQYALAAALLAATLVIMAACVYRNTGDGRFFKAIRWSMVALAGLLSVSSYGLLDALLHDDFKLAYVAQHSEKAMAAGYKAAAFWAGQEGSLLFWAWALALMGLAMAWQLRARVDIQAAMSLAVMAAVTGFFICVMLFAGDPFALAPKPTEDGFGLNPQLQNLAMVAHPPLLFLGYAGFTAPFAMFIAHLISGRNDTQWLRAARVWMAFAWTMLTAGILLGAQWAYVELGWGGYWAWDPVENASLLPWLTGTALLHSAVLAANRGIFKKWTAWLTAASFLLCILGTYLTRSGVIQSVHSFPESPIGTFFLVFMALTMIVSVTLIVIRRQTLQADKPLTNLVSREGLFLAGNVLLVIMTVVVLVGTVWPLLGSVFGATPVTVSAPFYNKVILPFALLLAALMSLGPVLGHGQDAGQKARPKIAAMMVAGGVLAAGQIMLGYLSVWCIAVALIGGAVIAAVLLDIGGTIWGIHQAGHSLASATIRTFGARPRHWGAQFGHIGLAAVMVGVAGSSVYRVHEEFQIKRGDTHKLGAYTITYAGLKEERRPNHMAVQATLQVADRAGRTFTLQPERRFYDHSEPGQSASEVAIEFGLGRDFYTTLAGWENDGNSAAFECYINPLVNWIWIGGVLLTLGGLICLLPAHRQQGAAIPIETEGVEPAPAHANGHHISRRERARQLQFAKARLL